MIFFEKKYFSNEFFEISDFFSHLRHYTTKTKTLEHTGDKNLISRKIFENMKKLRKRRQGTILIDRNN